LSSLAIASNEQNRLLSLVRNNTEQLLVAAFAGKQPIYKLSKEESLAIIDVIGLWMANLGVMNSISDMEINMIATFIKDNYNSLTIDEIKKAISLSITNKLNCDSELYNKAFSVKYVAKILEAYIEFKDRELADYRNRLESERMKKSDVPATPKEKMKISIDYFTNSYNDFVENNNIDYLYVGYEFLKRTKKIKVTQLDVDNAIKNGKEAAKTYMKGKYMDGLGNKIKGYNAVDIEQLQIRCAKSFIVAEFFKRIDFKEFISSFTETDFQ